MKKEFCAVCKQQREESFHVFVIVQLASGAVGFL